MAVINSGNQALTFPSEYNSVYIALIISRKQALTFPSEYSSIYIYSSN